LNSNPIDWTATLSEFVTYCGRFDATFPSTISGASEADVDRAEAAAGIPLPPEYRAFLFAMGNTPPNQLGGFFANLAFGIEAVEAFYLEPPVPIPADAVYLCTLNEDVEMFLDVNGEVAYHRPVLHFEWPVEPTTGQFLSSPRTQSVVAESLLNFLYRNVFLSMRNPLLLHRTELRERVRALKPNPQSREQRREKFRVLAERLGYVPVPHVNSGPLCYDRDNASLVLFSEEYAADIVEVRSDDERDLARTADILSDNLDFDVWG
jgi:hypothetical protein